MALNDAEDSRNSDEYYRELLARVDHAIVETRDAYEDDNTNPLQACCNKCGHATYQACLFVAAIVTETCVILHEKVNECFETKPRAGASNISDDNAALGESDGYEL